ncbi:MAG TPA: NUDIX domain-containing protein [Acidimicrobiales bacterium]|nr:NUDIX domain-containing protein [Acidimicrobiales bacterium]
MSPERQSIAVTVDVVLLTIRSGQLSVLLVQRAAEPFAGDWALPGGFVHDDEDLDAAAARELLEETGLEAFAGHLEQLRTYGAPGRDPRRRVVSVAYVGFMPDLPTPAAGSDAAAARWWAVDDLDEGPSLAFDHEQILRDAVERARAKLEYTPLAASFTEEPFTLTELRRVYEAVWGTPLHVGNFRRKVLSTPGFVEPIGEKAKASDGGRPAELYRRGTAVVLHPAMLRTGPEST